MFKTAQGKSSIMLLRWLVSICLLMLAIPSAGSAATITASQDEITLGANEYAPIFLVVTNQGTTPWEGKLLYQATPNLHVEPLKAVIGISAGKSLLIPVEISAREDEDASGSILFWLEEVSYGSGKKSEGADGQVVFAKIKVSPSPVIEIEKLIDVATQMEGISFDEYRESRLHLVVTNKSSKTLTGISVESVANPDLEVIAEPRFDAAESSKLPPGGQLAFRFKVKAHDDAPRGPHLIAVNVDIRWTERSQIRTLRRYVTQQVTVGTAGTSDILDMIGIPSLLLLPGFLFLVTFFSLSGRSGEQYLLQKAKNPAIWILSVGISLVVAYTYPDLTKLLFGTSRDFLRGYGLIDVFYVWAMALTSACGLAILTRLVWPRVRQWLWELQPDEDPLEALRKAAFAGGRMEEVRRRDQPEQAIYYRYAHCGGTAWIAPLLRWHWTHTMSIQDRDRIERKIQDTYQRSRWPWWSWKLWRLSRVMKAARTKGHLEVWWATQGDESLKPMAVPNDQLQVSDPTPVFVKLDEVGNDA